MFSLTPLLSGRRVVSLGLVAALAAPLISSSSAVTVAVDGDVEELATYAATVADVLEDLEVELGPADVVSPSLETEVTDDIAIEVRRAISVILDIEGQRPRLVRAPVETVAGVLAAAGVGDMQDAVIRPGRRDPVEPGDVIRVRPPIPVSITHDRQTRELTTVVSTVGQFLGEAGVRIDGDDVVTPSLDSPIVAGEPLHVVVQRVGTDEVIEEVAIPRPVERRETKDLLKGRIRVLESGADGVKHLIHRVRIVDGEEVERELVREEIVQEPVTRVLLVGTFVPPPAPRVSDDSVWDRLAQCESGGRWHYDGAYDGGLQFHPSTWTRNKPSGYPTYAWQATREQQIVVGKRVQARQGWGAWPTCARKLGLI